MVYFRENPIKMDDLGGFFSIFGNTHLFLKMKKLLGLLNLGLRGVLCFLLPAAFGKPRSLTEGISEGGFHRPPTQVRCGLAVRPPSRGRRNRAKPCEVSVVKSWPGKLPMKFGIPYTCSSQKSYISWDTGFIVKRKLLQSYLINGV